MTKRTFARVQRPHKTALIAIHLPEQKPPVGNVVTQWRAIIDHQRHTPAIPSKVYPKELGHILFQDRQSVQRDLCHTPNISRRFALE